MKYILFLLGFMLIVSCDDDSTAPEKQGEFSFSKVELWYSEYKDGSYQPEYIGQKEYYTNGLVYRSEYYDDAGLIWQVQIFEYDWQDRLIKRIEDETDATNDDIYYYYYYSNNILDSIIGMKNDQAELYRYLYSYNTDNNIETEIYYILDPTIGIPFKTDTIRYFYNSSGKVIKKVCKSDLFYSDYIEDMVYDSKGRLAEKTIDYVDVGVYKWEYTYNAHDYITEIRILFNNEDSGKIIYKYLE